MLCSFQQLFRSQQSQAATPSAAQLQLLQQQQQQQYLAQQQQAAAAAAAFPQPPYLTVNPAAAAAAAAAAQQEPYLITAGVPQYYGVGPWVYTAPPTAANLIQQGAAAAAASNGAARRPLTPNGTAEAQQQVQVSSKYQCCKKGGLVPIVYSIETINQNKECCGLAYTFGPCILEEHSYRLMLYIRTSIAVFKRKVYI